MAHQRKMTSSLTSQALCCFVAVEVVVNFSQIDQKDWNLYHPTQFAFLAVIAELVAEVVVMVGFDFDYFERR